MPVNSRKCRLLPTGTDRLSDNPAHKCHSPLHLTQPTKLHMYYYKTSYPKIKGHPLQMPQWKEVMNHGIKLRAFVIMFLQNIIPKTRTHPLQKPQWKEIMNHGIKLRALVINYVLQNIIPKTKTHPRTMALCKEVMNHGIKLREFVIIYVLQNIIPKTRTHPLTMPQWKEVTEPWHKIESILSSSYSSVWSNNALA